MLAQRVKLIAFADLLFWHSSVLKSCGRAAWAAENDLEELACVLELPHLAEHWSGLSRGLREISPADWEVESARLFDGNVFCPINETGYVRREKGVVIGDIGGFYRAFGFSPALKGEKLDHLSVELDFMGLLLTMAAFDDASDENREIALNAAKEFAASHPGEWLPSFAERLKIASTLPLYEALAGSLAVLWQALAAELGLPAAGEIVEPNSGDGLPCGLCEKMPEEEPA